MIALSTTGNYALGSVLRLQPCLTYAHRLRAMHGFRRMVVGEIIKLTGDIVAAAHFIGDKDLRIVNKSYTKRRDDQLREVAEWRATGRIRTDDRSITNRELYP